MRSFLIAHDNGLTMDNILYCIPCVGSMNWMSYMNPKFYWQSAPDHCWVKSLGVGYLGCAGEYSPCNSIGVQLWSHGGGFLQGTNLQTKIQPCGLKEAMWPEWSKDPISLLAHTVRFLDAGAIKTSVCTMSQSLCHTHIYVYIYIY